MTIHVSSWLLAVVVALVPFVFTWIVNRLSGEDEGGFLSIPLLSVATFCLTSGLCWGGLAVWLFMR